jgi:tetraacyldisaccharide 4'-kinase
MLSSIARGPVRYLLLPFALLYWLVITIRNFLYNIKIIRSTRFGLPLICVGNLSVGGTGKSPMVEYLVLLLKDKYKVATLSRGYKRKTKGYALADSNTTALEIGDEPMQFHLKFPEVPVAVGEERMVAIPQLLHDHPHTQAIILDDAFQHRAVTAGLNILLTDWSNLFTRDFYLPVGELRDLKSSYKRADIIVVTKCTPTLTDEERKKIIKEINPLPHQQVFFSAIQYGRLYHIINHTPKEIDKQAQVLLVSGIANPRPLVGLLEERGIPNSIMQYSDHHIFTIDDLKAIKKRFESMVLPGKIILTTEKDAVRLVKFNQELAGLPLYVIPVRHHFLFNEGVKFDKTVTDFIQTFGNNLKNT